MCRSFNNHDFSKYSLSNPTMAIFKFYWNYKQTQSSIAVSNPLTFNELCILNFIADFLLQLCKNKKHRKWDNL